MAAVLQVEIPARWAAGGDSLPARAKADVTGVVVHRIEVSQEDPAFGDSPVEVARFFREHPIGIKATGGGMPYPILIAADGRTTQTLPLNRVSPHAVRYNPTTVGVALIGDFRAAPPSPAQSRALPHVCAGLLRQLGRTADALFGHDELPGASRDRSKECPGKQLSMAALRAEVARLLAEDAPLPIFRWE